MATKYGPDSSLTAANALARSIGWFSIGLGIAELVAPGRIAKTFGLEGKEGLLRAFGAREIASGIGALSVNPQPALWARVAGDAVDMGALALGTRSDDKDAKRNAMIGIAAVAGIAALDAFAATLAGRRGGERPAPADYSDRSGFPKGVEAARGYYRQKRERGPAVAHYDAREDRTHSGGSDAKSSAAAPERTVTDMGLAPA